MASRDSSRWHQITVIIGEILQYGKYDSMTKIDRNFGQK